MWLSCDLSLCGIKIFTVILNLQLFLWIIFYVISWKFIMIKSSLFPPLPLLLLLFPSSPSLPRLLWYHTQRMNRLSSRFPDPLAAGPCASDHPNKMWPIFGDHLTKNNNVNIIRIIIHWLLSSRLVWSSLIFCNDGLHLSYLHIWSFSVEDYQ